MVRDRLGVSLIPCMLAATPPAGLRCSEDASSIMATAMAYAPKIPSLLFAMTLMDRLGRRKLLQTFVPLMGVCLATLSTAFHFIKAGNSAIVGVAALLSICL